MTPDHRCCTYCTIILLAVIFGIGLVLVTVNQ